MNILKQIISFAFCSFCFVANAQNFQFKNIIWAEPNCDAPDFAKTWWDSGNGKLKIYQLMPEGSEYGDVNKMSTKTKYGVGSYQFFSDDNYNEIYIFYSNNTAKLFERTVKGKLIVANGLSIEGGVSTGTLIACDPKSKAAEFMLNEINKINAKNQKSTPVPPQNKPANRSGEDYTPPACEQAMRLVNNALDQEMDGIACITVPTLSACIKQNGGRSRNIDKLVNMCNQLNNESVKKCSPYNQAKQTCAPSGSAANFEMCMNRLGWYKGFNECKGLGDANGW